MSKRFRLVLNVGHTEKSGGAKAPTGVSEWHYNSRLAALIKQFMGDAHDIAIMSQSGSYGDLPHEINRFAPDLVLSLHANAVNTRAQGSEVLYIKQPEIAEELLSAILRALGTRRRGIKKLVDGDRGFHLLANTEAPCFILEPFFIDNPKDYLIGQKGIQSLAQSLALCLEMLFMGDIPHVKRS